MPRGLLLAAAGLLALGWVGIARGEELGDGDGRFVHQQILWSLVAAGATWLATIPSYKLLGRYVYGAFAATLLLLVAVYFFPRCMARNVGFESAAWGCSPRSLRSSSACSPCLAI